jgi:hypothetical protein
MNIGAIRIATGIVGTSLLILVNTNIPNPRKNHTKGKDFLLFIFFFLIHLIVYSEPNEFYVSRFAAGRSFINVRAGHLRLD